MFEIFPRKGVETSWKSSIGHIVSLYGLSVSDLGCVHVLFSMLMYYNMCIIRLGLLQGEISHHVESSWPSADSKP